MAGPQRRRSSEPRRRSSAGSLSGAASAETASESAALPKENWRRRACGGQTSAPELTQAVLHKFGGGRKAPSSAESAKTVTSAKTVSSAATVKDSTKEMALVLALGDAPGQNLDGSHPSAASRGTMRPSKPSARPLSRSMYKSDYKSEFVDRSSSKDVSRVPRTIIGQKKSVDRLMAAISGDPRRQTSASSLQDTLGLTEHKKNFNVYTAQQMKDAVGVSPEIEDRKSKVADMCARLRARATAAARERVQAGKQQPQDCPSPGGGTALAVAALREELQRMQSQRETRAAEVPLSPSPEEVADLNGSIARELVKGIAARPEDASTAATTETRASSASRSRKGAARSSSGSRGALGRPSAARRGVPRAAAARAAQRANSQPSRSQPSQPSSASVASASGAPPTEYSLALLGLGVGGASASKAFNSEPSLSEALTTAPSVSSAVSQSASSHWSARSGARARSRSTGRRSERSSSAASRTSSVASSRSRASVTTEALAVELIAFRQRATQHADACETSGKRSDATRTDTNAESEAALVLAEPSASAISPKHLVSDGAPFATPFSGQFEADVFLTRPVQEESPEVSRRPSSAPSLGRRPASSVVTPPFAAPFIPPAARPSKVRTDSQPVARGAALAVARSRSALAVAQPVGGGRARPSSASRVEGHKAAAKEFKPRRVLAALKA